MKQQIRKLPNGFWEREGGGGGVGELREKCKSGGRERERVGGIEKCKSGQTEGERNVREERETEGGAVKE